jgi:hypothetical protein
MNKNEVTPIPDLLFLRFKSYNCVQKQYFMSMIRHHHLQIKRASSDMSEYKKKPKREAKKDNLGVFMVTDPDQAVRDVKKKEIEKEDDE